MISIPYRTTTLSASLLSIMMATVGFTHSPAAQAANVDADCSALYGSNFVPVTGQVTATSPTSSRPTKGVVFKDPNFGTCVVRASDHNADGAGTFVRNDYSRRQAFNADNTRFIAYSYNGAWHLYDAKTLVRLRELNGPGGDAEPQWDPTNPNSLYYIPTNGGTTLLKLDTETNQTTTAANFTGKLPWADVKHVWTKSEGSASADGRYWCFMAETEAFGIRGVFTYDLQTNTVVGTRSMSNRPDHVSMSASGRSCVVSDGDTGGVRAWDRTFSASRLLHPNGEHSDLALGADGSDYYVFVDYADTGDLVMVNVDTGVRTTLLPTYIEGTATAYHVSGKAFSRPGWVLLSTYDNYGGPEKWLHKRIMAVELKANPKIINLAHHHSLYNEYWTEPHASVSRDFSRVLFTSNWGTTSNLDVDAFMVRLPDNLFGAGGTTPPPPTCTRAVPTLSLTGPTGSVAAGSSQNYTVKLTNNDSTACTSTAFNLARSVPAGWTGTLNASSMTVSPGANATTNLAVTSSASATGSNGIGVGSGSTTTATHTANASATYVVTAPPASTCTRATPTVTLTGPSAAVAAGTNQNYTVSVTSNDSSACSATAYNLAKSVPSGWTGTLSSSSLTISPGANATSNLSVTSASGATAGDYGIGTGTGSSVGGIHTASGSSTYAVKDVQAVPAPPPTTVLSDSVTSNKAEYRLGETAYFSTLVLKNGEPVKGASISFTLYRPNSSGVSYKYGTTGSDGYARTSMPIKTGRKAVGSYLMYVSATTATEGASSSMTFTAK